MNAEARSWIAAVLKHSPQVQGLEGECWTNAKLAKNEDYIRKPQMIWPGASVAIVEGDRIHCLEPELATVANEFLMNGHRPNRARTHQEVSGLAARAVRNSRIDDFLTPVLHILHDDLPSAGPLRHCL